jgi:ABC-type branched-subunit amino acid transport system substrate-binding protein
VNKKFVVSYQAKFGQPPLNLDGSGFVTGEVILAALQATKGDPNSEKLHEAMKALHVDTAMGKIAFTPGNPDGSGVQGVLSRFIEEVKEANGQYFWNLVYEYPAVKPVKK